MDAIIVSRDWAVTRRSMFGQIILVIHLDNGNIVAAIHKLINCNSKISNKRIVNHDSISHRCLEFGIEHTIIDGTLNSV